MNEYLSFAGPRKQWACIANLKTTRILRSERKQTCLCSAFRWVSGPKLFLSCSGNKTPSSQSVSLDMESWYNIFGIYSHPPLVTWLTDFFPFFSWPSEGNGIHEGEQHSSAQKHRLRDVLHQIWQPEELLRELRRARGGDRPDHPVHDLSCFPDIYSCFCCAEKILSAMNRNHGRIAEVWIPLPYRCICSLVNRRLFWQSFSFLFLFLREKRKKPFV